MNILSADNLGKSYGMKVLFAKISFGLEHSDKVGIIGINGTGKSTLLKVIAGLETPDTGKVTITNSLQVEYLPQNPVFAQETTVLEQVFRGSSPLIQLVREYESVSDQLHQAPNDTGLQQKLLGLSQRMDEQEAWQLEAEAKAVLTKLGVTNFAAKVADLSGGMRKRVALAGALITVADLLILDEPTNHLDSTTVAWLEQYLNQSKKALLLITHDRYFLDRVVNKIFELDRGKLYTYPGNYSTFLAAKLLRLEQEQASEDKRQNLFRNELAWMRRGAQARTTKQKARIDRFQQLEAAKPQVSSDKVDISVGSSRLGKKVVELHKVGKRFAEHKVLDDFTYIAAKDDRIGIVGHNGCGKSTLLNLIAGRLTPDEGTIAIGETVRIGYFTQENTELDPDMRVIEYIREQAEVITTADGGVITASQMLERFLFSSQLQWSPIAKLSGGEKRRLHLLRILMSAPNVILLDEPTNDLDIQTLTILEDYLDNFRGAVLAVSHDRYFLDRIAQRIFAFEPGGNIREHTGNYSDYLASLDGLEEPVAKQLEAASSNPEPKRQAASATRAAEKSLKFSYKEQKEYEQIDELIAKQEQALAELKNSINTAGSDYMRLQELAGEQQKLEMELENLIERWTYLNELAEKIKQDR